MRKQSKIIFYAGIVLGFAAVLTGVALSGGEKIPKDFTVSYDGIKTADITAGVSVHDPSVIEADGTYYIFGSHMSGASSEDLRNWTSIGDGYTQSNPIFDDLLGTEHVFDYTGSRDSVIPTDDGTYHVWAPDVHSFIPDSRKIRSKQLMCSIMWTSAMQKRTTSSREINITMRNIQTQSIRPSFMMRTEKCGWSMARGRVEFSC